MNDSKFVYIADVEHNNDAVYFSLTELGEDKAVFENKEYDFPSIITYKLNSPDTLHIKLEGTGKDKAKRKIDLYFTRMR